MKMKARRTKVETCRENNVTILYRVAIQGDSRRKSVDKCKPRVHNI